MSVDPAILKPGRCILYRPSPPPWDWVLGAIISLKTWSWTSHIEVIASATTSVAARAEGVNEYPIRNDAYVCGVLEPTQPFDLVKAMAWFNAEARGDSYDVKGLFGFYLPQDDMTEHAHYKSEFCSMLADLFYRAGGFSPFAPRWPSQKIAPAQFWQSPLFNQIYPE